MFVSIREFYQAGINLALFRLHWDFLIQFRPMALRNNEYDPHVLQGYVDKLYREATWILLLRAVEWAIILAIVTFAAIAFYGRAQSGAFDSAYNGIIWGGILGALVGARLGSERATRLKLQAQQILLQMEIERNTRPADRGRSAGA